MKYHDLTGLPPPTSAAWRLAKHIWPLIFLACFAQNVQASADSTEQNTTEFSGFVTLAFDQGDGFYAQHGNLMWTGKKGTVSWKVWVDVPKDSILQELLVTLKVTDFLSVVAGQQARTLIYIYPPPEASRTIKVAFDMNTDTLIYDFYDQGIVAFFSHAHFQVQTGILMGAGRSKDNNDDVDFSFRSAFSSGPVKMSWAWQGGRQPFGYRAESSADLVFNFDLLLHHELYSAWHRRHDLNDEGWYAGWMVTPHPAIQCLVHYTKHNEHKEGTLGVNIFPWDGTKAQVHWVAVSNRDPQLLIRFQQMF
ncbi:MAG: hypothetical protein ABIJ92_01195 [Candidatus Aenigmatarchaeota archaeon]